MFIHHQFNLPSNYNNYAEFKKQIKKLRNQNQSNQQRERKQTTNNNADVEQRRLIEKQINNVIQPLPPFPLIQTKQPLIHRTNIKTKEEETAVNKTKTPSFSHNQLIINNTTIITPPNNSSSLTANKLPTQLPTAPPPPPQQQQSISQVKSRVRVSGVAWSGTGSVDNPNEKDQVMYNSLLDEFGKMAKMKHQQRESEFVAEMNRANQSHQASTTSAASVTANPSPIRVDTATKPLPAHTDSHNSRYSNGANESNRNNGMHANNVPSTSSSEPKKTETYRNSMDDIKREDFILQNAIIEDIFDGGDCDRVVVDFSSFFRKGEGILVGSSLDLMVLVLSDSYSIKSNHIQISSPYSAPIVEKYSSSTTPNPRLSPRSTSRQNNCFPFRISVGAVHSYVILSDGTPTFASMLRPGDAVLVFNRDGPIRTATVGRVSFESKPLSIVHISCVYSPSLSSGTPATPSSSNDFRVESDVFIENDATVFLSKDEHNRVKYLSINDGDVRGMTILSRLSSEYANGKRNRRSSYYANTSHDVNPPSGYRGAE